MEKADNTNNTPNREYKDGVFRMLFRDKDKFRELCNAVLGTDYGADTPMEEATLAGVLYRNYKNDVSYLVNGRMIVFAEHQSTICPNIALRFLGYMWDTYKPRVEGEKLLSRTKVKIPRPWFGVFYNGTEEAPKVQVVRLSDMFERWDGPDNPPFTLDLEAPIYNINTVNRPELLSKSDTLAQYETFIELVREYEKERELGKAIETAVDECITRGILTEFLKIHGAEVRNMLYAEFDNEKYIRYEKEAAREEGLTEGRAEGRTEGIAEVLSLIEQGLSPAEARKKLNIP
jgi:hypothetical protein